MRKHPLRVFVGTLSIVGGVLLLLSGGTLSRELMASGAAGLFGLLALVLFGTSRRWWTLPLGCALLTVAALQTLYSADLDNFPTLWGTSLVGLGGPFVGLYFNNHKQWGWLLPGCVLWAVGGALLLLGLPLPLDRLPTLGLWAIASLFFVVFVGNHRAWWALTPAYILWAIGAGFHLIRGQLSGEALATWVLWGLALLFWLGYLRDDTRAGRLWAASVLSVAGALPLLLSRQLGFWLAIGVSAGVGLACLAAWLRRQKPEQAS